MRDEIIRFGFAVGNTVNIRRFNFTGLEFYRNYFTDAKSGDYIPDDVEVDNLS